MDRNALTEPPPPPEWLTEPLALDEWNRAGAELVERRVLADTDLTALAHLCALHGHLVEAWASGAAPKAAMITQHRLLLGEFGLTPASRRRAPRHETRDPSPESFFGPKAVRD